MAICCAVGCANRSDRGDHGEMSFHRFPKDPDMRRAWTLAIRRKNWNPSTYTVLCADHFEESCYILRGKNKMLSEDAIPTLFPTHTAEYTIDEVVVDENDAAENAALQDEGESSELSNQESESEAFCEKTENAPESTNSAENISTFSEETNNKPPGSAPHVCYLSRTSENVIPNDSDEVLKRKLETVSAENLKAKKRLKVLQQKHRRNARKIARLEEVINSFKQNQVIDDDTLEILNSIPAPDRERLLHQLCTNQSKAFLDNDVQEFSSGEYVSDVSDCLSDDGIEV